MEGEINAIKKELKDVEKVSWMQHQTGVLQCFSILLHQYIYHYLVFLQELDFQSRKREKVHGDRFVESIGAFVRAAQNSCTELDDAWDELKQKVQTKHELVSYQLFAIGT